MVEYPSQEKEVHEKKETSCRESRERRYSENEAAIAKTIPVKQINNSEPLVLKKLNLIIQFNRKAWRRGSKV